jgi:hypothetical protein
MELLRELESKISKLAVDSETTSMVGSTVDLNKIDKRRDNISKLSEIRGQLESIRVMLDRSINVAEAAQEQDLAQIQKYIKGLQIDIKPVKKTTPETDWMTVVKGKKPVKPQEVTPTAEKKYSNVTIIGRLFLPAIKVQSFDDVLQNGELYYVEPAEHFAIRLAGKLLHGNIGYIYTEEKNPSKIRDCKFASQCIKKDKCEFYHDPTKFAGSKDKRNYIANSWLYSQTQFKGGMRNRRIGSIENLEFDVSDIHEEEVERFDDQTMHDILCGLVAKYNRF